MHAIICILYVIFNKVNKVQAKNKVQKVRTSQLCSTSVTTGLIYALCACDETYKLNGTELLTA